MDWHEVTDGVIPGEGQGYLYVVILEDYATELSVYDEGKWFAGKDITSKVKLWAMLPDPPREFFKW